MLRYLSMDEFGRALRFFVIISAICLNLPLIARGQGSGLDHQNVVNTGDSALQAKRRNFFSEAFAEQRKMNGDAYREMVARTKLMDSVFAEILSQYKDDSLFVRKMKYAQALWVRSLEADMDAIYPHVKNKLSYYGDVQPLCEYNIRSTFINRRISFLLTWLKGFPEGQCCGGSVKINKGTHDGDKDRDTTGDSQMW